MSSRFVLPFADVGSGIVPNDGAKLTFKNPGLETLKDTFSDAAGLIANTNPVIADATGLFPNIYINGDNDVVLQDKNNVQIWADSVSEFALVSDSTIVKSRATLAIAIADTNLIDGDALNLAEHTAGNGGGALWDAVLASSVTINTISIVQCTGVPTLALVLRSSSVMDSLAYGALPSVDAKGVLEVAVNDPNVSKLLISHSNAIATGGVEITRNDITIEISDILTRIVENPIPIANRGMFDADGKNNIKVIGDFDLKGEGSRQIGQAGFEVNAYNTVASRTGISGPPNSAVFFLRCSNIDIRGSVINTGESGYLLRNCGDVDMDVDVENCAGAGIEISVPAVDGSSETQPIRDNFKIRCNGKHVNDLKLGAGNGTTVSFAGSASNEVFRNVDIEVSGFRNSREIHQEFNAGSRIEGFTHKIFSRDVLQGAVATQGRDGEVTGVVVNPGAAGSGAVNTGYPSMYGYIGSTGSDNINVQMQVISTNDDGFVLGTDGAISAGSAVFTSSSASFATDIIGKHVVIEGANPSGAPLEAFVVARDSATQLTLDLQAQTTVSGATYGFGSGCRTPLIFSGQGNVKFDGSTVIGGVFSGLPSEPDARGIHVANGSGEASVNNCVIKAPSLRAGATAPTGLEIGTGYTGTFTESDNVISSFTANLKGYSTASSVKLPLNRKLVQDALPDAAADTFGTDVTFSPRIQSFNIVPVISVEFDAVSAETLTCEIELVFVDGGTNVVSLAEAASTTVELSAQQLATIHRDNQKITQIQFRTKSSKISSTAKGRLTYLALEG